MASGNVLGLIDMDTVYRVTPAMGVGMYYSDTRTGRHIVTAIFEAETISAWPTLHKPGATRDDSGNIYGHNGALWLEDLDTDCPF